MAKKRNTPKTGMQAKKEEFEEFIIWHTDLPDEPTQPQARKKEEIIIGRANLPDKPKEEKEINHDGEKT